MRLARADQADYCQSHERAAGSLGLWALRLSIAHRLEMGRLPKQRFAQVAPSFIALIGAGIGLGSQSPADRKHEPHEATAPADAQLETCGIFSPLGSEIQVNNTFNPTPPQTVLSQLRLLKLSKSCHCASPAAAFRVCLPMPSRRRSASRRSFAAAQVAD